MINYLFFSMDDLGRAIGIMLVVTIIATSILILQADKSERNIAGGVLIGMVLGFITAVVFYVGGGVSVKDRLNFCNKFDSVNYDNLEEFSNSCIFYKNFTLTFSGKDNLITDENGHIEVVLHDKVEREIIESSYNKVIDQVIFGNNKKAIDKALDLFEDNKFPIHTKSELRAEYLGYLERNMQFEENSELYYKITKASDKKRKGLISHEDLKAAEGMIAKLKELELEVEKGKKVLDRYCLNYTESNCVSAKSKLLQAENILKKFSYKTMESALMLEKEKIANSKL